VQSFPWKVSFKGEYPLKRYFTDIGLSSVKTAANRHRHAAFVTSAGDKLFRSINIDDIERPQIPETAMRRTLQEWIATKWL